VKLLVDAAGVDVNRATSTDHTPLHAAVWNGHLNVVVSLIAAPRVNVNRASVYDTTPLSIALVHGRAHMAQRLRAAGAAEPHG
jgi:ankyrin repeat protein